jgi:hypothetical protein
MLQTGARSRSIKGYCTIWCGCSSPFKFSKQPRYRPCARPRRSSLAISLLGSIDGTCEAARVLLLYIAVQCQTLNKKLNWALTPA